MAQTPCFTPLAESLLSPFFVPFTYLETLLAVTGSVHLGLRLLVNWPPLSQPFPFPPHSKFPVPRLNICALLRRLQESGFFCPEHTVLDGPSACICWRLVLPSYAGGPFLKVREAVPLQNAELASCADVLIERGLPQPLQRTVASVLWCVSRSEYAASLKENLPIQSCNLWA